MEKDEKQLLETYRAEYRLMDDILAKGPGNYKLRLKTHANCIALRSRMYKARSADRRIAAQVGAPFSEYDRIRILGPVLSSDGLTYQLPVLVLKSADEIVGLLEEDST
jgi:hypothetical protein